MVANALQLSKKKVIVIAAILSLLFLIPITGTAVTPKQFSTRLVLETPLQEVNNGDTVIFAGKLLKALDGVGIPSATVTLYDKGLKQYQVLASGSTDSDGYFKIQWVAKPVDPLSNTVNVFAAFDGNVEYEPSRTFEYNIDVVTKYNVSVRADKDFYYVGDRAVFTVEVASPTNNPIDPKNIHSFFDMMIVKPIQIDTGHYRYVSDELTHGIHTLSVNVKISTPESKFRADFNSISSAAKIHVTKRPTTTTASVNEQVHFIGDEITVDATLFDVVRNGYITDKSLTGYFTLPDLTKRNFTLTSYGNSYNAKYIVQESDSFGNWTGTVTFDGDYALQSSASPLASFKVNDYRVKPTVTQEGNVTIINVKNHEDNELDVYEFAVSWDEGDIVSMGAPSEWSSTFDDATKTVHFSTNTKPIKPGKALTFQFEPSSLMQSFTWEAGDVDSDIIVSGKYPLS